MTRHAELALHPATGELWVRGRPLALGGQPAQILQMLAQRPGELVSREELQTQLWPKGQAIDTERRLNTAVRALRAALEAARVRSVRVETLRGRGYRLTVDRGRARSRIGACLGLALLLIGAVARIDPAGSAGPDLDAHPSLDYLSAIAAVSSDERTLKPLLDHASALSASVPGRLLMAKARMADWRAAPSVAKRDALRSELERLAGAWTDQPDIASLLGELLLFGYWDWRQAERWLDRASSLSPRHADALRLRIWLYLTSGRQDRAEALLPRLLATAPFDDAIRSDIGWLLIRMGLHEQALALCSARDPAHPNLLSCQHTTLSRLRRWPDARAIGVQMMRREGAPEARIRRVAAARPEAGYRDFLSWRAEHADRVDSWFIRSQWLAEAGREDAAAGALSHAFSEHDPRLVKLASTPELRPLMRRAGVRAIWTRVSARG